MTRLVILLLSAGIIVTSLASSVAVERPADFRSNCYLAEGGCECAVLEGNVETVNVYDNLNSCRKSVELQTADNKKKLNAEINEKYGGFKDNCFPKPSGGCKCNVDEGKGEEVREFSSDADCKKSVERQTSDNKKKLNEEIAEKFGGFKENCFPKPSGGCKCNEKDLTGADVVAVYDDNVKCQKRQKREERPSQNVRDPVREKAQASYAMVLEELKNKFKGLREGCYPRPKGCLCVVGKTPDGREETKRLFKESECKCREGERGNGCPAA